MKKIKYLRQKKKIKSLKIQTFKNLNFEKLSWWYFLMLPLILLLALWVAIKKKILGENLKTNTFWFDGVSPYCRKVKENATTWRALDIIYNYIPKKDKSFAGRITDFWNNLRNIKSVRNRLKLAKKILIETIESFLNRKKEIKLLSIASGSAQGVIEVMKIFKEKGITIKAIFLDKDPTAIEYSQKLARKAGVIKQIIFANKNVRELEKVLESNDFTPNIIEMIGFLEYRIKEKAIDLVQRIYKILPSEGVLLISNLSPNLEMFFSHYVGNWPMIYRRPKEFVEILSLAGFSLENCTLYTEPLRVHYIAKCRKI